MWKHPEQLFVQRPLGNAVVVKQPRLRPPADVEGAVDVGLGPRHDLAQLRPVVHLLKLQVLHRRAGDDKAVIFVVLDLLKGGVEGFQMRHVGVMPHVAGCLQQLHLDLKRRVGQLAQQLGLGDDLGGHEVEDKHLQRTNILMKRPVFGHGEDVLRVQRLAGGQGVRDANGHGPTS